MNGDHLWRSFSHSAQTGVSLKILEVLKHCKYEKPTPIQAQAIPAIMSGRDLMGELVDSFKCSTS